MSNYVARPECLWQNDPGLVNCIRLGELQIFDRKLQLWAPECDDLNNTWACPQEEHWKPCPWSCCWEMSSCTIWGFKTRDSCTHPMWTQSSHSWTVPTGPSCIAPSLIAAWLASCFTGGHEDYFREENTWCSSDGKHFACPGQTAVGGYDHRANLSVRPRTHRSQAHITFPGPQKCLNLLYQKEQKRSFMSK